MKTLLRSFSALLTGFAVYPLLKSICGIPIQEKQWESILALLFISLILVLISVDLTDSK